MFTYTSAFLYDSKKKVAGENHKTHTKDVTIKPAESQQNYTFNAENKIFTKHEMK